jgi:two-component system, chemotaxis family, CheB/CheR fusion protein
LADSEDAISQLIVIGSSAGGIDALSAVVRTLPSEMSVPVLVAQHLDPRRPSHLTEILRRHSALRVETVDDHARLEPNTILVLPPGSHAEISDHEIRLSDISDKGPRPSIDLLFTSAAQVFGEGLIAVILTGTGHDGAAGARDVKALGGTVIVQNPETASYPGMPLALAPTSIDIVAELDAIGPLLHDLAAVSRKPRTPDDERLLGAFLDQLRDRSGIDFGSYKRATILRRLQRRMVATSSTKLRDYVRYVQDNPEEYQRLTASFLIKVTEFFRDADLFERLRAEVIPQLIEDARERDRELRLWSAGCATGEEAYSLAMLIADALGDELESFNVRIFATDVDADAITFARRGIYLETSLAGVPPELVERHFTKVAEGYEVRKRIRAITVFGQHDLGQRAPFPRVDLALCRNVLIYFTTELQKRALQLFAFSLRDGGFLVLGKAESTTPLPEYFVLAHPRLKIYRRQGDRVLIPPTRIRDSAPLIPTRQAASGRRAGWIDATLARTRESPRTPTAAEKAENLLLRLPVGVVVVDRSYDILSINATARSLLGIHGAAIGSDLVHLVPPAAADSCRTVIDVAFRGETAEVTLSLSTASTAGSEVRSIRVSGHALQPESGGQAVALLVADVTLEVNRRHELEEALARERAEREQVVERGRQLAAAHGELLEANSELTTSNAELRSANEELLVANEEVQAATEEVETLNEELQATNEELETLNEELQATVEELNTTTDDLQARNLEALGSADPADPGLRSVLAAARRVLEDVTAIAIVGPSAELDLSNRPFRALFEGTVISDERDRKIATEEQPIARARRGEAFEIRVTVRRGRRRIGDFTVISTPLGPRVGGPVLVEAEETEAVGGS